MAFEVNKYNTPIGQFYSPSKNIQVVSCPGLKVAILIFINSL